MSRPSPLALLVLGALVAPAVAQDWRGHARVDGRVTDARGTPLPGATVTAARPSGESGPRVTTDAAGEWVLEGIASGSWTIAVSAPGFRPARIGVHLPNESSWLAPAEVRLQREPPPAPDPPEAVTGRGQAPSASGGDADSPPGAAGVRAALASGRTTRARDLALGLGADDTSALPLLVEVGTALLAAGSTTDAVTCLDRALEAAPTHPEARYRRALALLALGRHAEARRDFETLLELDPDGPHAAKARLALEELREVAR